MTTPSKSQAEMAAEKYADSRTITRDLERASVIASFEAGTHYADEEMERLRAENDIFRDKFNDALDVITEMRQENERLKSAVGKCRRYFTGINAPSELVTHAQCVELQKEAIAAVVELK